MSKQYLLLIINKNKIGKYEELQLKRKQNIILSDISYKLKRINYNC